MKLHLLLCVCMLAGCGTAATVDIEVTDSGNDSGHDSGDHDARSDDASDAMSSNPFLDSGSDSESDSSTETDSATQDAAQDSSESICVTSSPQACQEQLSNCEEYDHYPVPVCKASFYLCMFDWTSQCGNPVVACSYLCLEQLEGCIESTGDDASCQATSNSCTDQCTGVVPPMDAGHDAIADAASVTDADDSGRHHHDHDASTHGCGH